MHYELEQNCKYQDISHILRLNIVSEIVSQKFVSVCCIII